MKGGPPVPGPIDVASQVYSGTNFRKMFGGPNANYEALGDAGNFAYGAVAAQLGVPKMIAEIGAGIYSLWVHPAKDWVGPYFMDPSASQNVPAGYHVKCQGS